MLKIMKKPIVFKSEEILTQATMNKIKKVVEKERIVMNMQSASDDFMINKITKIINKIYDSEILEDLCRNNFIAIQ